MWKERFIPHYNRIGTRIPVWWITSAYYIIFDSSWRGVTRRGRRHKTPVRVVFLGRPLRKERGAHPCTVRGRCITCGSTTIILVPVRTNTYRRTAGPRTRTRPHYIFTGPPCIMLRTKNGRNKVRGGTGRRARMTGPESGGKYTLSRTPADGFRRPNIYCNDNKKKN